MNVKRYFDAPDERFVAVLDVSPGSQAAICSIKIHEEMFDAKLREIDAAEYARLKVQYEAQAGRDLEP